MLITNPADTGQQNQKDTDKMKTSHTPGPWAFISSEIRDFELTEPAYTAGLAAEMGIALTFDKWGRAEGFKDWEQEQYFNRTLHARDFLLEPLTTPEVTPEPEPEPEPVAPVHTPCLCW